MGTLYLVDGDDLTYEANQIRAKTGGSSPIEFVAGKGFGDYIDAIPSGGGGTILLASGTYTKTDNATKPLELKIPVSFTGTPTEAYIIVSEDVGSGTNRILQCWGQLSTDKQVIQDNFPKWPADGRLQLGLGYGKNTSNADYIVKTGGAYFSDSTHTYLVGGTISSQYQFKNTTYNWYIWGYDT